MTLTAAIKALLQANETIRALCDDRVTPVFAGPFNAIEGQAVEIRPAIVITCVARAEEQFEGLDAAGEALVHRYRITAMSLDFDEAETLGRAVRGALHFLSGEVVEGVTVRASRLDAGYHEHEPTQGIMMDINEFEITAEEATTPSA